MNANVRFGSAALATAAVAALAAAGASGRGANRNLWATVNVCRSSPAQLGIRGQMPGDGTHEQMYMRFTAQYRTGRGWARVPGHGRSPWKRAGSATKQFQQFGWTFGLARPAAGQRYVLRGFVEYEWRARRSGRTVVVRRAHAVTESGHPGTVGAKPHNYSSATCRISRH